MSTSQGVIFLKKKNVNGESKWFEDGDEENDGKYVGEIENGKPNGTGTITFPDGTMYVGKWKDGFPNGQGTETYPNGGKYLGSWKGGLKWNGTYYDQNGNITGKYVNGGWIKQ